MYEGFDYGGTNVALNTIGGSATGLTGSYTGAGNYVSTGLTFGSLETTGGSANLIAGSSNQTARRQLDTGTVTGTIYGSFLFQQASFGNTTDFLGVGFGTNTATDNTATVIFLTDQFGAELAAARANPSNAGSPPYQANGTVPSPAPPTPIMLGLYEITNVGAVSGTQSVTYWTLSETQFESFRADGMTTAELNAASIGGGTTDVTERIVLSISGAGGYIDLNNGDFLNLIYRSGNYSVDEIRVSNLDLNEVTPIPEPGSVILVGLAGMAMVVCRRRRF